MNIIVVTSFVFVLLYLSQVPILESPMQFLLTPDAHSLFIAVVYAACVVVSLSYKTLRNANNAARLGWGFLLCAVAFLSVRTPDGAWALVGFEGLLLYWVLYVVGVFYILSKLVKSTLKSMDESRFTPLRKPNFAES